MVDTPTVVADTARIYLGVDVQRSDTRRSLRISLVSALESARIAA